MPEEEKKTVDIDTSGPDATIDIEEAKDESVVETEAPKQETVETKQEEEEVKEETVTEKKEDDSKLEEYSRGVQSRIAKLTRKMREAERREKAALEAVRQELSNLLDEDKEQNGKATVIDINSKTKN